MENEQTIVELKEVTKVVFLVLTDILNDEGDNLSVNTYPLQADITKMTKTEEAVKLYRDDVQVGEVKARELLRWYISEDGAISDVSEDK